MVRERPPGDPPQKPQARRVRIAQGASRGNWNAVRPSPIILSQSKDKRQGAKAKEANEAGGGDEAGDADAGPGLFDGSTGAGSVAAE